MDNVAKALLDALQAYADANGARWKMKLVTAWMNGEYMTPELQQARNVLGPTGLYKLRIKPRKKAE